DQSSGPRLVDHFDLIAGTSTGGILAIGLGLGMTASQMRDFYVAKGPTIFPIEEEIAALYHSFRHWFGAQFHQSALNAHREAACPRTSGAAPVPDPSLARLVTPTYDTKSDTPIVLRTPHGIAAAVHRGRQAVEVALATAAAPTYFDPLPIGHYLAVDGGV